MRHSSKTKRNNNTNPINNGPMVFQEPEVYLSRAAAARELGCCLRTIGQYLRDGKIRFSRLSPRKILIRKSDLTRAMEKFSVGAA